MRLQRVLLLILVMSMMTCLCSDVRAGRQWAPGIQPGQSGGSSLPPLQLRLGGVYSTTNQYWLSEQKARKAKFVGLDCELGVAPFQLGKSTSPRLAIEVPLAVTATAGKAGGGDDTHISLMGRVIPSLHLILENGPRTIEPYVGLGGGVSLFYPDGVHFVWAFRLGTDIMLTKRSGIGVTYTRNQVLGTGYGKYTTDYYGTSITLGEDFVSSQLVFSLLFRL